MSRIFTRILCLMVAATAAAASAQSLSICPIGDSITEGYAGAYTYRYFLWRNLQAGGYRGSDFEGSRRGVYAGSPYNSNFDQDHESRSGWRIDQVYSGAVDPQKGAFMDGLRNTLPQLKMEMALIFLGHNDIGQGQGTQNALGDMEILIDALRERNPQVVIFLGLPFSGGVFYSAIKDLTLRYPGLAERLHTASSPIIPVDFWHTAAGEHTIDGVHPDARGDSLLAAGWYVAVDSYLRGRNLIPSAGIEYPLASPNPRPEDLYAPRIPVFRTGYELPLRAAAHDPDGSIQKVEFYIDGSLAGVAWGPPYEARLPSLPDGDYELAVRAFDDRGAMGSSARLGLRVAADGIIPELPPGKKTASPIPPGQAVDPLPRLVIESHRGLYNFGGIHALAGGNRWDLAGRVLRTRLSR